MATSSKRTPPPFPETEDMDVDTEIEDLESNESEYTLVSEDVIGQETDANNVPDDLFSGSPTVNVSYPLIDSIIKSDTDAINKLDEQPNDMAPKEKPNKAPDNSFLIPLSTDVSKPEDGGKNPLIDPSESDLCSPNKSSAKDFLSESVGKPLAEWELETVSVVSEPLVKEPLSDVTEQPVCDDFSELLSEPVSDSKDIPVVDVLSEPVRVVSEPVIREPLSDVTEQPVCDDFSELLSEPVSDSKDIPVVDVLCEPVRVVSEPVIREPLSDVTEQPVCNDFSELLSEPVSDSKDIPVVDVLSEPVRVVSEPVIREPLSDVTEQPVCDDFSELLSEPVSDSKDIPVVDVPHDPGSVDSVIKSDTDAINKLDEQPIDMAPKEEPNKAPDLLSTDVSKPEDGCKNPLIDPSESVMCTPDKSSAEDFLSESVGKPLAEWELETDSDPTNELSLEAENDLIREPVSDCQDIPVVDVLSEPVSVVSEPLVKEPLSDVTQQPVCDDISELLSEPVSDCKDIPVVDGLHDPVRVVSEPVIKEPLSDVTEQPVCDDFSGLLSEPVSDCQDIPVVDALHEPGSVASEPLVKDPLSDVTEQPVCDDFLNLLIPASKQHKDLFSDPPDDDLFSEMLNCKDKQQSSVFSAVSIDMCLEAKNTPINGPLSDDMKTPPSDVFSEDCVNRATSPVANPDSSSDSRTRDEEEQDIFAEATVELSLDSPAIERKRVEPSRLLTPASSTSASSNISKQQPKMLEEPQEEDPEDKFELNVSVTNPEKVGEGMNAYMAYKVSTQTTLPMFKRKTFEVRRRFSDFLGMYEKLSAKLSQNGYIVPPPPEKSFLGMTKMKVGKEDPSSVEFVEKRRAALERFLQKVLCHPTLLQDPDVREFLEREELPRAVNTQAFSGAGFLKIINRATEAVSKMTIKMDESDVWFEEKLQEVEGEDQQLRKLHAMVDSLVNHRKDLSAHTAMFAKSIGMLGSSEDNTALSRALCQLAEVEDKIEQLHQEQAANDFFIFAELLADYIRLLGAVRGCFDQRMKMWQRWQDAQNMLQKKREVEAKLLWANKPEKLQLAKEEITEWEAKVTQYERDFERISATVRKEVIRFEKEKAKDFKKQTLKYLQVLVNSQQQLIKYWEAFLPEAKAIA